MARIAGVDIPDNKRGEVSLTYVFGIGKSSAQAILDEAGVDRNTKVQEWSDDQTKKVREFRLQILDLNIPIHFEDERLSSLAAAKSMKMEKIKTGFNNGMIDKRAAAIILQQFLDKKKIIK